jgi:hypothetical protein
MEDNVYEQAIAIAIYVLLFIISVTGLLYLIGG